MLTQDSIPVWTAIGAVGTCLSVVAIGVTAWVAYYQLSANRKVAQYQPFLEMSKAWDELRDEGKYLNFGVATEEARQKINANIFGGHIQTTTGAKIAKAYITAITKYLSWFDRLAVLLDAGALDKDTVILYYGQAIHHAEFVTRDVRPLIAETSRSKFSRFEALAKLADRYSDNWRLDAPTMTGVRPDLPAASPSPSSLKDQQTNQSEQNDHRAPNASPGLKTPPPEAPQ